MVDMFDNADIVNISSRDFSFMNVTDLADGIADADGLAVFMISRILLV